MRPVWVLPEGDTEMTHYAGIDVSLKTSGICRIRVDAASISPRMLGSPPAAQRTTRQRTEETRLIGRLDETCA